MERLSSAVRLDLRPGEWVLWKQRPFRLISLQGSAASIRDSVNGEMREVAVAELRGMPSLPPEDFDRRVDLLRITSDQSWHLAQRRESIIRELLKGMGSMAERVAAAGKVLDISPRTVRRLVKQYRTSSQTTNLIPKPPGPHLKRRRLGPIRERIIDEANRVLHILAEIGTKLLCIDEVHHLLAGSQREQRRALNLLKFVANELKIAVVVVGTQDAFHAMQVDSQVASRFEPLLLPRWTEIDGFRGFVTGYGRLLPLRKPSPFGDAAMIRTLLELSGGITGNVTALLARAAEAAILDGSEHIDPLAIVKHHERLRSAAA